MNIVRFACVTAIALVAFTPGCGGQEADDADLGRAAQEQKSAGYGYEFKDDAVKNAAAPSNNQVIAQSGKLAPETIRDVVRGSFGGLRTCYEDALTQNPALEGNVSVKFVIHQDGSVSDAERESATISDAAMVACVVNHFATIQFPASSGGDATVIYPLMFSPNDGT
jgi:hypothetical protein